MNWLKKIQGWIYNLLPERKKHIPDPEARTGGAEKSPPDERDYTPKSSSSTLPNKYSLRQFLSRVESQGSYNSCVAHAITTCLETINRSHEYPHNDLELSRMHCWNMARQLTWGKEWNKNAGVFIRDGWKVAQTPGITIEKLFPYTPNNDARVIHDSWIWRWAIPFKYRFISSLATKKTKEKQIKEAIAFENSPVVFGAHVSEEFINLRFPSLPYSYGGQKGLYAHAMLIVGYDDVKDTFTIMNSWGTRWGTNGFVDVDKNWILDHAWDLSYAEVDDE